ncbi:endonuclease III domain-containing protein [Schaalia suimastitidis]|uniref:endonuclease III domain-containing protein n=1 Tax=Schaalia suimastitidis TaxID=121163 RepID=UPI000407D20B|nr:deoxyribonuclease [Schaalia suimastitidis]
MTTFRALFDLLASRVDAGRWWPAQTDFEVMVGAVLTQNTSWTNVCLALDNLRDANMLHAQALAHCDKAHLESLIRPAGFFRAKSAYLQSLSAWYIANGDAAAQLSTDSLRQHLLALVGVGPETADDIVLYVYRRPVFIYDLYARRLLEAANMGAYRTYEAARRSLDTQFHEAGFSADEAGHFHGLIVEAGKVARTLGGWQVAFPLLQEGTSFQRP